MQNNVDEEDEIDHWHHQVRAVEIYSSQTGRWTYHQSQWGEKSIEIFSSSVFYNGALHVTTLDSSGNTVDTEGKIWRTIPMLYYSRFIGMSQGLLYAVYLSARKFVSCWAHEQAGRVCSMKLEIRLASTQG